MRIILLLIMLSLAPSVACANPIYLTNGMSMSDVIKLKGPPREKDEHEVSRVIKWKYDGETLVFKNGLLSYRTVKTAALIRKEPSTEPMESKKISNISQAVADDIMNAIPNDPNPGASASSGPQTGNQGSPGNSPVMIGEDE